MTSAMSASSLIFSAAFAVAQLLFVSASAGPPGPVGMTPIQTTEIKPAKLPPVHAISATEKNALNRQLQVAADSSIKIESLPSSADVAAPVSIMDAKVRAVKREAADSSQTSVIPGANDYAIRATLVLRNGSRLAGIVLQFTNPQSGILFSTYVKFLVEAGAELEYEIPFMLISGDPADLQVEVVGCRYQDGTFWGSFPEPSRAQRPGSASIPASSQPSEPAQAIATKVDSMPKALNRPRPNYTEEARFNGVSGAARLRLLVDVEGAVKRTLVQNPLPDGLTTPGHSRRGGDEVHSGYEGRPASCFLGCH
jgi:hypothetical protein